jgi:hypothetical protein
MMLGKRFVVYLSIPYSAVSFGIMQYDFAGVFTRKHVPRDHRSQVLVSFAQDRQ